MASTSNQAPSSSIPPWSHDVFLSFRGKDTRKSFTDHLYTALVANGIHTFRDDEELDRGEAIAPGLLKANEQSRISIVIFSENYAHSRWCLDEVIKIVECVTTMRRTAFPVFYHVDRTEVRNQTGNYAKAFMEYEKDVSEENREKVQRWRAALKEASNLSGWHLHGRYESEIITEIIEHVLGKLMRKSLHVGENLVGMDTRLKEIHLLINMESKDVRMVGVHGIGGIGKTTIVKAIYNQIACHFEGISFIANVREVSGEYHGLVRLQEQLIHDILLIRNQKLCTPDEGISYIKDRLCSKKVLIILDDVDDLKQLESLVGRHDWFGKGSRIIITTRDKHMLTTHGVDELYEPPGLSEDEALSLFSQYAFKGTCPDHDFLALSNNVISYCQGLPLAIKVLGSFLFSKTCLQWKSELDKLDKEPNKRILDVLKVSYDGLSDTQKEIFLDVACFFKGDDKDFVIKILDGCGFFAESGVRVLYDRCLITISDRKIWMHNLIQQLGWEIVRQQGPKEIGRRSRLWDHVDIHQVLAKRKGTYLIEGIFLDSLKSKELRFTTETFSMMTELRLFKIFQGSKCPSGKEENKVHLSKEFQLPSYDLRYLHWHGYPSDSLPSNFLPENLVELNMPHSGLKELWKANTGLFITLAVVELSHSQDLRKISNISSMPNLEKLILEGCTSLHEIDPSIGNLNKLFLLNLRDRKGLAKLPDSICNLGSLETLIVSGCAKLNKLPDNLGSLQRLRDLNANGTAIGQLPSSIDLLKSLEELSFSGWKEHGSYPRSLFQRGINWRIRSIPLSLSGLCSLRELDLSDRALRDGAIPDDFWCLSSLQKLNLSRNPFSVIPTGITQLSNLTVLQLWHCTGLLEIPELPSSVQEVDAHCCRSLGTLSTPSSAVMASTSQTKVLGTTILQRIQKIVPDIEFCILLPGSGIPEWFRHQSMGSKITMELPPNWYDDFSGFAVSLVFEQRVPKGCEVLCQLNNFAFFYSFWDNLPSWSSDHVWLAYQPRNRVDICHPDLWTQITASFEVSGLASSNQMKECGIHLMYANA